MASAVLIHIQQLFLRLNDAQFALLNAITSENMAEYPTGMRGLSPTWALPSDDVVLVRADLERAEHEEKPILDLLAGCVQFSKKKEIWSVFEILFVHRNSN